MNGDNLAFDDDDDDDDDDEDDGDDEDDDEDDEDDDGDGNLINRQHCISNSSIIITIMNEHNDSIKHCITSIALAHLQL